VDWDAYHYAQLDSDSETNTDHAQFRQYSDAQGRWLSPDPYSGSYDAFNPQSFNRYVYVGNNPLAAVDPTGLLLCFNGACNFNKSGGGGGGNPLDPGSVTPVGPADGSDGNLDALNQAESGGSGGGDSGSNSAAAIYAAYMVACSFSTLGCTSDQVVIVRYVGFTYNVQIPDDLMDPDTLPSDATEDLGLTNAIFHGDAPDSYYLASGFALAGPDVAHIVDLPLSEGGVEAHIDHWGPANPIHWGESILSLFINTRAQAGSGVSKTCSPNGGCQ
jgi:RHS repeat-associated protein